jgi:hypothetical protein
MQLQLPIFPVGTKMVSHCVGVYEQDGFVQYIINGLPVYCHSKDDLQAFRFFCSNLISQGLCSQAEIRTAFSVTRDYVSRAYRLYKKDGEAGFFKPENRHGYCYKLIGDNLVKAQRLLDEGCNQSATALAVGVSESAIRYAINAGHLKKNAGSQKVAGQSHEETSPTPPGTESWQRSQADKAAPLGIATTNTEGRVMAAAGLGSHCAPVFESHNGLDFGGVLFLLPALLLQGLFTIKDTHQLKAGYYPIDSIVLTLAFMALCRIKNPEQLKQHQPGELGRLIGLDRVPELKCLRSKIKELSDQGKATELSEKLLAKWMPRDDENIFLYADGHLSVYNGYLAKLPVKYVSRQKLCLNATTGFWLNDQQGMPLLVFTGELNEKLQHAIENELITQLIKSKTITTPDPISDDTPAVCTIVFDREAYEPAFFMRLWVKYRIAVITYRKNVKDKWDEQLFEEQSVKTGHSEEKMQLCEQQTQLGGHCFREVRCLTETGHQTPVITTHPLLSTQIIAGAMFNRWTQENFFKYMISDFSFDHILTYRTDTIDDKKEVVNPAYRKKTYQIKKEKEKGQRLKARLMVEIDKNINVALDNMAPIVKKQARLIQEMKMKDELIDTLKKERETIPKKIILSQMSDEKRYTKLNTETRLLSNLIKMICYRAETVMANHIEKYYNRSEEEKRMLVKQIIQTKASISPDYNNNTLTVTLHTLSTQRYNHIAEQLTTLLNETETCFPQTNLKLIFKTQ